MDQASLKNRWRKTVTPKLFWSVAIFLMTNVPAVLLGQINYGVRTFTIQDGLSQVLVTSILQDRRGFMWFGTKDGLDRFDGYSFKVYKSQPEDPYSLSDNYILCLKEDRKGRIWVGTWGGGLDVYDPASGRFSNYRHDPNDPNSLSNNDINVIHVDDAENVWIGTKLGGLDKLDPKTGRFEHFSDRLSNSTVRSIAQDKQGNLWIGTQEGLDRLVLKTGVVTQYNADPRAEHRLDHPNVEVVYVDSKGLIWVGTDHGLNKLDPQTGKIAHVLYGRNGTHHHATSPARTIYEKDGRLWIGGLDGLYAIDPSRPTEEHYASDRVNPHGPLRAVISIYEDRTGLLWFGTSGFGLVTMDARRPFQQHQKFPGVPDTLSGAHVYGIMELESGLLCMGTDDGLNIWDPKTGHMQHIRYDPANPRGLTNQWVFSIIESRGILWLATRRGLNYVVLDELSQGIVRHYLRDENKPNGLSHNHLSNLFVGPDPNDDTLWVGTQGGLNAMDRKTGAFRHFFHDPNNAESISHNEVRVMLASTYQGKNIYWVGTEGGGLCILDPISETFSSFPIGGNNGLSHGRAISLYEQAGNLWIGTRGGGLNRLEIATGRFSHFREADGLPNDTVYGILPDEAGNLWLSTNLGLARFDPLQKTFKCFRAQDGIQGNEFNSGAYLKDSRNRLLFGGTNGLTMFDPKEIRDNPYEPQVALTDFQLFNEQVLLKDNAPGSPLEKTITESTKIILTHKQNMFSLHFAALDFASPTDNQYLYKMEQFNPGWLQASVKNRVATYTNLDAGTYTFRVIASNRDGVWNQNGTSLQVIVLPSPLRTLWAYALYVFALLGLVIAYLRYQERIRRKLERTVTERTQELRQKNEELVTAQKKLVEAAHTAGMAEIATGVLHNLGNSLNSVQTSVHLIEEKLAEGKGLSLLKRTAVMLKDCETLPDLPTLASGLERIAQLLEKQVCGSAKETEVLANHVKNMIRVLREQRQHSDGRGWLLEPVNVNEFIQQAVDNERSNLREGKVNVHLDLNSLPLVKVEKFKFERVLSHIIRNAREATALPSNGHTGSKETPAPDQGLLTITTSVQGDEVVVKITDNGTGIDVQNLTRIFVSGFSTKKEHRGVGLHYCANAMREMSGHIGIDSQGEDKGTSVTLRLSR